MRRSAPVSSVAICLCLGVSAPLFAPQPSAAGTADDTTPAAKPAGASPAATTDVAAIQPAEACLSDVRSFSGKIQKDGYWLGGSDYDYGYPMGVYAASMSYSNARPG